MGWLRKLTQLFNAHAEVAVPRADHIAEHGHFMRSRGFVTPNAFSLEEVLADSQQKTITHWEATLHPQQTGLWTLRQIETCGDIRNEGHAKSVSFEEALNTMSLMEEHQSTCLRHAAASTHDTLGEDSYIRLAEKEGYVQNTDGYMVKRTPDDNGGSFDIHALERAKKSLAAAQAEQNGLFHSMFGNAKPTEEKSLDQMIDALQPLRRINDGLKKPLSKALEEIARSWGYEDASEYKRRTKVISRAFDQCHDYIHSNPDNLLTAYDQKKIGTLFGAIEVEIYAVMAQDKFQNVKRNLGAKEDADLLHKLNTLVQKTWESRLPNLNADIRARTEAYIMQGPQEDLYDKKRANMLGHRVLKSFNRWVDQARDYATTMSATQQALGSVTQKLLPAARG